jgi:hypothetical protein
MSDPASADTTAKTKVGDPSLEMWKITMKRSFDLSAGATTDARDADRAQIAKRVKTLETTFNYVKLQSPELAIKPMTGIMSELNAALAWQKGDQNVDPKLVDLKDGVQAAIMALKGRAGTIVAGHVAAWTKENNALPAAGAGATPKAKSERALAIQSLVAKMEAGIKNDTYMLQQVDAAITPLAQMQALAAALKQEYQTLLPKRITNGPPPALPKVARPAMPGALSAEKMESLNAKMTSSQALMGQDKAIVPEDVLAAVAIIQDGIRVDAESVDKNGFLTESAEKSMKRLKTWVAVKEEYRARLKANPDDGKKFMARMWWFRRAHVDGLMTKLQQTYDFIWGSVGSDNPESDYDLTVRTHPKKPTADMKWDYQIVAYVNKELTKDYGGGPPGIVFDTNLYAEAPPKEMSKEQQALPAVKAVGAMKEQGQDVGALMKLRRFMEWDEYEDYKANMLAGIETKADRELVARQFEEADALFFIARAEQLRKAAGLLPSPAKEQALAELDRIPATIEGQKQLADLAAHLEEHDGARAMAANNEIYAEKLTEVRKLEEQYDAETDPEKKAALLARLKSYQADATFFAAEAYHSEGPLQHVVKAGQSSRLEIEGDGKTYTGKQKDEAIEALKQKKLAALSANQMLQSFNENLGDLLKDLRHYAAEPYPGLGFYRCSKYIERLCDAVSVIGPKLSAENQRKFAALTMGGKAPSVVQAAMKGLVDIRGEKKGFADAADPEMEKQAYAIDEMKAVFPGVVTLPDLAKVVSTFGQQVNTLVRSEITAAMQATMKDNPYFPKDGKA